jgi:glycosyltransferase involved in cell wall biosynthesis
MRVIARMNVGGPAQQITTLMRQLDRERFEHRLYTGTAGPLEADHLRYCARDVLAHTVPGLGRSPRVAGDARALAYLVGQMRTFAPHIVHTHTAKAGVLGRLAARLAGVPVTVHTFHGHLLHGYFPAPVTRAVVAAERALARHTDRLLAVGERVRDDLLRAGIGVPEQYRVLAPGVVDRHRPDRAEARRRLGLPANAPVLAYVGRLAAVKRPDRLRAIIGMVRDEIPDAVLAVCGGGSRAEELHGVAGVHLLGWRPDVETVYAAADIAVLASDNEGTPLSLIEAARAGVPAVAPRVGSVPEVVADGETGLLAPADGAALARQVLALLRDPALRQRLGAAAAGRAALCFGAERLIADTERIYADLAVANRWWAPIPTAGGTS